MVCYDQTIFENLESKCINVNESEGAKKSEKKISIEKIIFKVILSNAYY